MHGLPFTVSVARVTEADPEAPALHGMQWEETLRAHSGTYTEAGFSASKRAADCKQLSYASARQHTLWKTAAVKTAASLVSGYYPGTVSMMIDKKRAQKRAMGGIQ